jgi:hypothetical protein
MDAEPKDRAPPTGRRSVERVCELLVVCVRKRWAQAVHLHRRAAINKKLDLHSTAEIVMFAALSGLLKPAFALASDGGYLPERFLPWAPDPAKPPALALAENFAGRM